ncbi:hypothetical protein [Ancylobacter sp. IITR112]|uniref:hypothetical protein n=1 Tax=Ancylobacter sp. IITR112 TaxID=3138073 RepID=UPI00352B8D21
MSETNKPNREIVVLQAQMAAAMLCLKYMAQDAAERTGDAPGWLGAMRLWLTFESEEWLDAGKRAGVSSAFVDSLRKPMADFIGKVTTPDAQASAEGK